MILCLFRVFNRTAKYIRLGITNLMVNISDDSMVKQFDIAQIFVHPLRQNTRYNDIALFRIDGEVEFTEYIRPACLAQPESVIAENLLVTGWGQINSRGTVKMDLQKIRFNLVSHADCYASYKFHNPSNLERGIDNETQICARSETKVRDACQVSCQTRLVYMYNVYRSCIFFFLFEGIWGFTFNKYNWETFMFV